MCCYGTLESLELFASAPSKGLQRFDHTHQQFVVTCCHYGKIQFCIWVATIPVLHRRFRAALNQSGGNSNQRSFFPILISAKKSNKILKHVGCTPLQGTNIYALQRVLLKMVLLSQWWDMLVPWRVFIINHHVTLTSRCHISRSWRRAFWASNLKGQNKQIWREYGMVD